ncbi:trihelix transcription factor GTL1-like [Phragmites australis]|uniref:trihelix transcription factor GTL1-like n=1 Tax=Phragmites australis TaxID=29695 RepID=UPI002D794673|nr:trihelix transcription factor GTL1-like [Phragmites australis]
MLHHHGGAGYPYKAPTTDAVSFSLPPPMAMPVSVTSIPPPLTQQQLAGTSASEELPAGGSSGNAAAYLQEDDLPADVGVSGAGASGSGGNRWPREETLALIRIRSEMDAAFRNAPLKAPLWEDVARKLAGLGYQRSAKKCKEKFENVDKYYKRTKEARSGRQDGKSYRFFAQLEALHAAAPQQQQQQATAMTTVQGDPQPLVTMAWATPPAAQAPPGASLPDLSFSSMSGSESESDDEFDNEDQESLGKGESDGGVCDKEMMALFEGMMRQVTEKQDAMQRVFLETLERWEAERTAREEAWRRQEVARMNREREQLARERAAAASRDAALIAFLQRVGGGHPVQMQLPPATAVAAPTPMPDRTPPSPHHDVATTSLQPVPVPPKSEESWTSSRWPKEEVQALIQLRREKDEQYHDAGSKGPLWEDIAAGMRRIGYNRSAKRCKEKWENINKYFKKVKESNKRRPEDSKTCPYFHQLDAMYRKKRFAGRGRSTVPGANMAGVAATGPENPNQRELEGKASNDIDKRNDGGEGSVHAPPGSSDTALADGAKNKKSKDIVRETNAQPLQQEFAADETDSDDMGGSYTDEGNDEDKM